LFINTPYEFSNSSKSIDFAVLNLGALGALGALVALADFEAFDDKRSD
jgi:hypothetical protein